MESHSWLCLSGNGCAAQEIVAVISAGAALLAALCSTVVGVFVLRSTNRNANLARQQTENLQGR